MPDRPAKFDGDDLTRRAFAAWYRSCKAEGAVPDQPSAGSGVVEHGGRLYVQLHNVNGILAVYRVRNDGMLRRMRRWPQALASAVTPSA